jgi:hypothetical protein
MSTPFTKQAVAAASKPPQVQPELHPAAETDIYRCMAWRGTMGGGGTVRGRGGQPAVKQSKAGSCAPWCTARVARAIAAQSAPAQHWNFKSYLFEDVPPHHLHTCAPYILDAIQQDILPK